MSKNMNDQRKNLVIVPAYNEEANIAQVIQDVKQYADVLVVDDGSRDSTTLVAAQAGAYCLRSSENQGVIDALLKGTRWGNEQGYSTLIFLDADGSHNPSHVPLLLEHHASLNNALTVGARADFRSIKPTLIPSTKYAANFFATSMTNLALGTDFPDVACGYRVVNSKIAEEILKEGLGFGGMYEMLRQVVIKRLSLGFCPISVRYDAREPLFTSKRELMDLLKVLAGWARIRSHALETSLKCVYNHVLSNRSCSMKIHGSFVCLVPINDVLFAFQVQHPYFADQTSAVIEFQNSM